MEPHTWQELFDYNYWCHRRLWACLMQLSDEQFTQEHDGGWSIQLHAFHAMAVEAWWFHFLETGEVKFLEPEQLPDLADLCAQWDQIETQVRGYLARLTPAELERDVMPSFWKDKHPIQVRQALFQLVNHSTDHRAQILSYVRRFGALTLEQDFLEYLFTKQG
jgi:uncharacterized damage-inducible protein DinB